MNRQHLSSLAMGAAFLVAGGTFAMAADPDPIEAPASYPRISGEIEVEIENDNVFKSDDPTAKMNDLYATIGLALAFELTPMFSIQTGMTFEPVLDPTPPGKDRWFGDEGVYVEEIYAQFENGPFRLFAGKFNPSFGTAWDKAPGIYGADFAEDYQLTERIGGGAAVTLGDEATIGEHTLTANVFFADTSFLSNSGFTKRGRTKKASGGLSNTKSLESFSITVDGEKVPALAGVAYHAGFSFQKKGVSETHNETGFVFGLSGEVDLGNEIGLGWLGEVAHLNNAGGAAGNATYYTAGVELIRGPWNTAFSFTHRDAATQDKLFQASAGYEFENGLSINGGYRFDRQAKVDGHTLGVVLAFGTDFVLMGGS